MLLVLKQFLKAKIPNLKISRKKKKKEKKKRHFNKIKK